VGLRIAALAWLVLAFGLGGPAYGQDDSPEKPESVRSGPYVGVNFAGGIPNFDGKDFFVNPSPTSPAVQEEPSFGINARAGWRIFPFLAVEAQYEWIDEWEIKTRSVTCAIADAQVVTGNLRLLAPFRVVHPYLLAGVGAGLFERAVTGNALGSDFTCEPVPGQGSQASDWELVGRFGGGFDIYVTPHIVLNLESTAVYSDQQLLGTSWPYISISGGFQYRF
jgi:opacity protein-like surface antigen